MPTLIKRRCYWLLIAATALAPLAQAESGERLAIMGRLQLLSHKLYLSMAAENSGATVFYTEELQGSINALQAMENYGDYPVGHLATTLLLPSYKTLLRSVKSGNLTGAHTPFMQFVDSCNNCHALTEHGFIKINVNDSNPYFQQF